MWTSYATMSNIYAELQDTCLNKCQHGFFFLNTSLERVNIITKIYYRFNTEFLWYLSSDLDPQGRKNRSIVYVDAKPFNKIFTAFLFRHIILVK